MRNINIKVYNELPNNININDFYFVFNDHHIWLYKKINHIWYKLDNTQNIEKYSEPYNNKKYYYMY